MVRSRRTAPTTTVLVEDRHLLAVNKAPGISVLADRTGKTCLLDRIRDRLAQKGEDCFVVHRLDKGTSGVLLFAKTQDALREISRQFEEREVNKLYLALVRGTPSDPAGKIDLPLLAGKRGPLRVRVDENGKSAVTEYRVVESFGDYSSLEVTPCTGRTHQIRAHLAAIGHPLAVDPVYGGDDVLFLSNIKPDCRPSSRGPESPLIDRLSLHATPLGFRHPATGKTQTVEAPQPHDFAVTLKQLRKHAVRP